ncbi:DUF3566 domain-containing protein [Corynebacterium sp. ES2794-CONJ1]|uniref:DUF3566 domain-containing protein n=1 Tax=unclassified Corynebacterium TaxID=2624378 RepID=UPI0021689C1C|nr:MULTISPECIES: DUF3566 domain-containing protein [unclassified Corynebacterium]MCS4490441.1 DUF3566 domain-containing protein [Corynebacterium sp. ES2775-CONJ]MCS4492221.1 DUF3566 domain-containing protein [Corynebacterium sp. ES2715-CONJ3]MCS4532295.1 DUF3566 domain-containing protein [Corynebacterium sp. ES2730-CONJ]MCU9519740.1 DUF3566 domain-containing protein [Corynebacterium sp. ES2794-CONJ1]
MATRISAITHIAPLSVFRVTFILSTVLAAAGLLSVTLLYFGMDAMGVWDQVNQIIGGVGGTQLITFPLVMMLAGLLAIIFVILTSVLLPLIAVCYNATTDFTSGLRIQITHDF